MVLLYVFATIVAINLAFYFLYAKFSFLKENEPKVAAVFPVSVLVCAKNEAENLQKNIPFILQQEYKNFELILINDGSSDETLEVMEAFAENDPRIQVVNVENNEHFWANKKYALTLGIKRAKNTHLLFTDADCKPASSTWLSEIAGRFSETKQLVLGYGAYEKKPGFLNKIIRFETFMTAVQYFSYAKAGIPYMGVGRNLAYTSELYYNNRGFITHIKVPSGDDDLFVNEVATAENTAIVFSEESFTYSTPKTDWKSWKNQKKRHLTTAHLYKSKHQFLLATHYIANVLFWLLAIATLAFADWRIALLLIIFRIAMQYLLLHKAMLKLKEQDLFYLLPFYEVFLVCVQMSIFISNSGAKPQQWK